jgi:tetratricopeptide (TPR) repeat protein
VRALIVIALLLIAAPAEARRDRTVLGDAIRASRMIASLRIDEAEALINDLARRAPDAVEIKWLRAELAFHRGDYADAVARLTGVPDDAVSGEVGRTRTLAARTLAVTSTFVSKPSPAGHFEIFYAPGPDEVIVELAGETLDAAWNAIGDDLGLRPRQTIRVELLARPRDLAHLSTLTEGEIETTGTIALSKYGKLMVVSPRATVLGYAWMDTLAHEYVHLVVSQLSGDQVPVWLQEGLARFEQARWRSPQASALPRADQSLLASALRTRRLIDLDDMHPSMAKLPSQEAAALAYAEVFTLVAWMHGKVGYEGLRQVIARQKDGKSARRAVSEVMGMSWPEVEKTWRAYLGKLNLSGGKALAGRAGRRIRFDKGGRDDDNVGVDEVSHARARKHARLGGMLRARNMLDAASIQYEKALTVVPGDPFVAGKLARTYVELGKHDRAVELARPLLAVDDQDAAPAVTLGVALAARGDHAAARDAFEQALRTSPFDPAVRCGLADVYDRLKDPRVGRERSACERLRR